VHRRREAKDLRDEEVVSAIGQVDIGNEGNHSRSARNGGGASDSRSYVNDSGRKRSRFSGADRNGGGDLMAARGSSDRTGRLTEDVTGGDEGFKIRGRGSSGFSILGASRSASNTMPPPDLFDRRARTGR
jgi:hypothetical protein